MGQDRLVTELYGNRHVWERLTATVESGSRTDAAIAYVGRTGAQLLPFRAGDSIIIDGSDQSLKNGTVHPDAVATWLSREVAVHSLSGLHAKVLVVTGEAPEDDVLFVGSANASRASKSQLAEATLATSDADAIENARTLLVSWTAEARVIDDRWLTKARRLYAHPPETPRRRRTKLTLERERLWIGQFHPTNEEAGPETEAAVSRVLDDTGNAWVDWWQMDQADADLMRVGDTVVLARASGGPEPHGRANAGPPGKVMAIVPARGPYRAAAIYAYLDTWNHTTWARVCNSVGRSKFSFDEPITERSAIDSVLALFDF